MNIQFKILLYIAFVFGILYFVQEKYSLFEISFKDTMDESKQENVNEQDSNTIEILNTEGKSVIVEVEVADTLELRKQGLSGRKHLGDYQGMFFIMENEGYSSYWMKDMYISLDIIFINTQGYIVDIAQNQLPCTTDICPSINSSKPFKYVLEVNGGFCKSNMIDIGNSIIIKVLTKD